MIAMGTLRIHHNGTFCMSSSTDLRYAVGKVHDEDIEYHRVTLLYLEERVKSLGYMHFKDIYYKDPYVEKFGKAVKVINSKQELIHMWYLLNEKRIIDVYVEHVCDEQDILDLLEGGTVVQELVDEVEGDADETDALHGGDATQQEDLQNNDHDDEELPEIVHNDADDEDSGEGYALHGGDAAQQEDLQNNDHDDEDLLDIVPSDADDEEVLESICNKKKHKASASARKNANGAGPSGTVHDSPTTINEEDERVLIGTDDHGDLGSDSSFENSEDEFEVSSDDSGEYNVVDEHELEEEEEEDVRTTRSSDLWFNPSWTTIWFEVGMRFEHVAQFKEAIAEYQIQKGCKLKPVKSDPTRHRIHCVGQQCNWSIFASFDKNDKTFKIRISEIVRLSHLELGVHVSRDKCKLAKERIMREVKETHTKEFAQLRGYAEELLRLSP
ncbi:hypothetical protein SLEP1_g15101 [Rubroshorea leprosula]|uniref:Transposase MuDR plant domain-containing protein n=1 Tax=Rubroshorea leprosula TaxID=152421 RepID=A0AAV5IVT5_9ROSI|nr:hypothetical protein SLEP1_g15101 [Rubroshorea leprosula]